MSSVVVLTTVVGKTDIGMVRKNNEDAFIIANPETGQNMGEKCRVEKPLQNNKLLLVVSDGMGGYEGGEVASQLTVDSICSELMHVPKQLSPQSRLESAIEEANRVVWNQRQQNPLLQKMGATATVMMLERDKAYIAEVGDSRAYIIRDGRIKQLTTDQTMVQMLVDYGAISPEDAAKSSNKNVLLQAIGNQEFLQVAVTSINIQANDLFLLCSDGLSGKVQAKEIKEIVVKSPSLEAASTEMIELAKRRGGEDNITVVIARVEGNGLKAKAQAETLTKQIQVLSKYDPSQDVVAKPKREVRPATFQDWLNSAVIDSFCRQQEQKSALAALEDFGEYIVFRKGDLLVSPNEPNIKEHYWLVAGRYRVMIEVAGNDRQMIGFFVPPTDQRLDADIQDGDPLARVRRQFFIANLNMLGEQRQNAIIRCEDEENAVIRIPDSLFEVVAPIFGERYVNIVRHS